MMTFCPVCCREVPADVVEAHVNQCLDQDIQQTDADLARQIWEFENKSTQQKELKQEQHIQPHATQFPPQSPPRHSHSTTPPLPDGWNFEWSDDAKMAFRNFTYKSIASQSGYHNGAQDGLITHPRNSSQCKSKITAEVGPHSSQYAHHTQAKHSIHTKQHMRRGAPQRPSSSASNTPHSHVSHSHASSHTTHSHVPSPLTPHSHTSPPHTSHHTSSHASPPTTSSHTPHSHTSLPHTSRDAYVSLHPHTIPSRNCVTPKSLEISPAHFSPQPHFISPQQPQPIHQPFAPYEHFTHNTIVQPIQQPPGTLSQQQQQQQLQQHSAQLHNTNANANETSQTEEMTPLDTECSLDLTVEGTLEDELIGEVLGDDELTELPEFFRIS
eukprot:c5325_g1_i2.p1 GENE.c5325_g1_i2~~c5325_g1_i2.p1  ORF type:complete len:383 (-),score=102.04 c5325_g1_i2:29-1177(-)